MTAVGIPPSRRGEQPALRAWKEDKQLVTLFLSLPLPDDGGRLVRHHFGDAAEMIWLMD